MSDVGSEWADFVRSRLNACTVDLVSVLRRLIGQTYPPQVVSIDFELFPDGFTGGAPVRAFFMDATNGEFFIEEDGRSRYPSDVDPNVLAIDEIYSVEEEDAFSARPDAGPIADDLPAISATAFIDWFAECWRAAGGASFHLRSVIMVHDDPGSERMLSQGAAD
jgi:hypothetical protein